MKKINKNQDGFSAVEAVLIIVVVVLIGVAGWLIYKNNHKKTETKKTGTTQTTNTNQKTSTTTADPYAGWTSANLKYEKLSLKYPKDWKIDNASTANGTTGTVTPGSDKVTVTSPSSLEVEVRSGVTGIGGGPFYGKLLSVEPIVTMGGNYFLGFGNDSPGDDTTTTTSMGCVGTKEDVSTNFPNSKYITLSVSGASSQPFNVVCIRYSDSSQKTIAQFQNDPSFNDAKMIVKSLAY